MGGGWKTPPSAATGGKSPVLLGLKSVYVSPAVKSCTQDRLQNHSYIYHLQRNHARLTGFGSQLNIGITCSQDMHAEQALKSQFNTSQFHYRYHLQLNHAC